MKFARFRIIGTILAILLTVFILPGKIFADCSDNLTNTCVTHPINCGLGVGCCDTQIECKSRNPLCDGDTGVNTALGCLHAGKPGSLIIEILNWAVVLGIGIAFLMIIFAGFQITTASGDPKRVKAGQELITSAIAGLMLILFSIVLLNFIGVQLLGLPGFVGNATLQNP